MDPEDFIAHGNQVGSFKYEAVTYPQPGVLHVLKMKVKALRLLHLLPEKRDAIFNSTGAATRGKRMRPQFNVSAEGQTGRAIINT